MKILVTMKDLEVKLVVFQELPSERGKAKPRQGKETIFNMYKGGRKKERKCLDREKKGYAAVFAETREKEGEGTFFSWIT